MWHESLRFRSLGLFRTYLSSSKSLSLAPWSLGSEASSCAGLSTYANAAASAGGLRVTKLWHTQRWSKMSTEKWRSESEVKKWMKHRIRHRMKMNEVNEDEMPRCDALAFSLCSQSFQHSWQALRPPKPFWQVGNGIHLGSTLDPRWICGSLSC